MMLAGCAPQERQSLPPEIIVAPDLSIGGADLGPASFSRIRSFAVDRMGRIYIADVIDRELRVFDSTGNFVRRIGRRGRGPGEFISPDGLAFDNVGNLYVYDPQQRRLSRFDSSGSLSKTHYLPITSYSGFWNGGIDSTNQFVDLQLIATSDTSNASFVRRIDLESYDTTLWRMPDCGFSPAPTYTFPGGVLNIPFGTGLQTWIEPGVGMWCYHSAKPSAYLVLFGSTTASDSVVSLATADSVSSRERDEAIARVARQLQRAGAGAAAAGMDYRQIPKTKPLVLGITRDDSGRIWLHLHDNRGPVFHVFAPSGLWIARVRPTVNVSVAGLPSVVRGRYLYVIDTDSLDVPSISRIPFELPQ